MSSSTIRATGELTLYLIYFSTSSLSKIICSIFNGSLKIRYIWTAIYTWISLCISFLLLIVYCFVRDLIQWVSSYDTQQERQLLAEISSYDEFCENALNSESDTIREWKSNPKTEDFKDAYKTMEEQINMMNASKSPPQGNINIDSLKTILGYTFQRNLLELQPEKLYKQSHICTKDIIGKYYKLIEECAYVIASADCEVKDRIEWFENTAKAKIGRTALFLSGGGSLSMFHCGVIRVLVQNDCLPKVVTGAAGGALCAGYLAVNKKLNIESLADEIINVYSTQFLPPLILNLFKAETSLYEKILNLFKTGLLMTATSHFTNSIKKMTGDLTMKEAYEKSNRHVNIIVSYSANNTVHQLSLNRKETPNVFLWSAIVASCALPGSMKPQRLLEKDQNGNPKIYCYNNIQSFHGSVNVAIPKIVLKKFRVKYIIASQIGYNVQPDSIETDLKTNTESLLFGLQKLQSLDKELLKSINACLNQLSKLKCISQDYGNNNNNSTCSADITIMPSKIPFNLTCKIISDSSKQNMKKLANIGEKATWPHLKRIQDMFCREKLVDDILDKLVNNKI